MALICTGNEISYIQPWTKGEAQVCVEYVRVTEGQPFRERFGGQVPPELKADVFPLDAGLLIRRPRTEPGDRSAFDAEVGIFGLVPPWAKDIKRLARACYNARSETVATKPAFRSAWRRSQRALIPVAGFYEPNWESGRAVRWKITLADGQPFAIAGLWEWNPLSRPGAASGDGASGFLSFSMLTINADAHPVMRRFHAPGDEKRSVVILQPADYGTWLDAPMEDAATLLRPFPAELMATEPAPRPARPKRERPPVPVPMPKAALSAGEHIDTETSP